MGDRDPQILIISRYSLLLLSNNWMNFYVDGGIEESGVK